MNSSVKVDPMSMGKAIAVTNFVMAVVGLTIINLMGAGMTSVFWKTLLITPIMFALAGLVYGLIGGTIYNLMVREKSGSGMYIPEQPS